MSLIPLDKYTDILKVLPILCADVVVQNASGEYLLIKRNNEPKKGEWWVIGGRVLKGETLEEAARRKVKQETCLEIKNMRPIGCFELVNGTNPFELPFDYHSVSVVFSTIIDDRRLVKIDNQSVEFKFTKELPVDFIVNPFGTNYKDLL